MPGGHKPKWSRVPRVRASSQSSLEIQVTQNEAIITTSTSVTSAGSSQDKNTGEQQKKPLFRPNAKLLVVFQKVGAEGDTFTWKEMCYYLREYIRAHTLFDLDQPSLVHCGTDILGGALGVTSFTINDVKNLLMANTFPVPQLVSMSCHSQRVSHVTHTLTVSSTQKETDLISAKSKENPGLGPPNTNTTETDENGNPAVSENTSSVLPKAQQPAAITADTGLQENTPGDSTAPPNRDTTPSPGVEKPANADSPPDSQLMPRPTNRRKRKRTGTGSSDKGSTSTSPPDQAAERPTADKANRRRQPSFSIIFASDNDGEDGDWTKSGGSYPWFFRVDVQPSESESDVLSIQSKDTVLVRDSSDDYWFLEEDDQVSVEMNENGVSLEFQSDSQFLEYEVADSSSSEPHSDDSSSSDSPSEGGIYILCDDSDEDFFADYSDLDSGDEDDDDDKEISDEDYWRCSECETLNPPLRRYCDKCYQVRAGWLPEVRPRFVSHRKQFRRSVSAPDDRDLSLNVAVSPSKEKGFLLKQIPVSKWDSNKVLASIRESQERERTKPSTDESPEEYDIREWTKTPEVSEGMHQSIPNTPSAPSKNRVTSTITSPMLLESKNVPDQIQTHFAAEACRSVTNRTPTVSGGEPSQASYKSLYISDPKRTLNETVSVDKGLMSPSSTLTNSELQSSSMDPQLLSSSKVPRLSALNGEPLGSSDLSYDVPDVPVLLSVKQHSPILGQVPVLEKSDTIVTEKLTPYSKSIVSGQGPSDADQSLRMESQATLDQSNFESFSQRSSITSVGSKLYPLDTVDTEILSPAGGDSALSRWSSCDTGYGSFELPQKTVAGHSVWIPNSQQDNSSHSMQLSHNADQPDLKVKEFNVLTPLKIPALSRNDSGVELPASQDSTCTYTVNQQASLDALPSSQETTAGTSSQDSAFKESQSLLVSDKEENMRNIIISKSFGETKNSFVGLKTGVDCPSNMTSCPGSPDAPYGSPASRSKPKTSTPTGTKSDKSGVCSNTIDKRNVINEDEDSLCMLCFSKPKEASIIHGKTGHQVCCYRCARTLKKRRRPCPVCRKPIQKVIRNYVV